MGINTPYIHERHDIGILRANGTDKVGLMLAQKNGVPVYEEYDDEYIATQQTQTPGYENLPVEKELAMVIDDYRSGFGMEIYDTQDPKRYFASYNADLRFKGIALLSQKAIAVALPTTPDPPTMANGDMEINGSWTNGSQSAAQKHGGSWSWLTGGGAIYVTQTLTWNASYQSKTFYFYGWIWSSAAGKGSLFLYDGKTYSYSSTHSGSSAWEFFSVAKTFAANATEFTIGFYNNSAVTAVYYDDAYLADISGASPNNLIEFNDLLYIGIGSCLFKMNGTGDGWTFVYGFPTTITDLTVFSDGYLYIGQGYSFPYGYMNTSQTVTISIATIKTIKYFCMVRTTVDTMYGSDTANTIRSTINPKNGGTAWSAQTTIDVASNNITDLLSINNALYVMKEDRPYYLDSTGAVKVLTNSTVAMTSSTSGKNSFEWQGKLYMPWGTGLLEYDAGDFTWLNPTLYCTNILDYGGQVMGLGGDEQYLFAGVNNSWDVSLINFVEILAGRYEVIDDVTRWVWHPICNLALHGLEFMMGSSVYQKRLWILSTSSLDSIYYIPLPLNYGDVANDANKSFQTGGYFITPWLHGNFKADTKAWIKITLTTADCDSNVYWTVEYEKLGDTVWTTVGNFTTSPSQSRYIPVDAGSVKPSSKMMRFKITGTTNTTATTPILYSYEIRAVLYPTSRNLIYCQIRCADQIIDKQGKELDSNAAYIKTVIDEARASTYPLTLYDIDGNTRTVKLLPMPKTLPKRNPIKTEKGRNIEWAYNLLMEEVNVS